jgi:Tol biopolymer transport system component
MSSRAAKAGAFTLALCLCIVPVLVTVSLPAPGFKNTRPVNYRPLTSGSWDDASPAWSPDGTLIAFSSDRSGGWAVYVAKPYGTGERQLTPSGIVAANPSWSPDSARIAYWCLEGNTASIKVVTVSNSSIITVSGSGGDAVNMTPVWSPDGSHLLFYVKVPTLQLMCVDMSTLSEWVVAAVNGPDFNPIWAGKDRVVYSDTGDGLYVMKWTNLTSGKSGILNEGGNNYWGGAISPDGTMISYYSNVTALVTQLLPLTGNNVWFNLLNITEFDVWTDQLSSYHSSYLYVTILHQTKIRPGEVISTEPLHWSPGGGLVACVLNSSGTGLGVYVWSVSNNTVTRMGPSEAQARQPSWSPNGTVLALSCNATGSWHIWIADYAGYNAAATW